MATKSIDISEELFNKINQLRQDMSVDEYLEKLLAKAEKLPFSSFGSLKVNPLDYNEIKDARIDKEIVI